MELNHRHADFQFHLLGVLRHPPIPISTLQQGIGDGRLRWVTVSDSGLGTKVGTGFPSASVWLLLGGLVFLRIDALLDPLRKEPRFHAIERTLRFPG